MTNRVLIITSSGVQAGKTHVRRIAERLLDEVGASSSDYIYAAVAARLGLDVDEIRAARATDPDAYRAEMVRAGDAMARAGLPPGLCALRDGRRIVDGIRRPSELDACYQWVQRHGYEYYHIHLRGGYSPPTDNTDRQGLAAHCAKHGGVIIGPIRDQARREKIIEDLILDWWN